MKPGFLGKERFFVFYVFRVGYTAIDGANGCTLWLFMKAHALSTFIVDDVIELVRDGCLRSLATHNGAVAKVNLRQFGTATPGPLNAPFIDGGVGAFGFAGTTVDALVGDHDSHEQSSF